MTKSLTSDQLELVQASHRLEKWAVAIALTSGTVRYCTGDTPVTISVNVYRPGRLLDVTGLKVGEPDTTEQIITLDNADKGLTTTYYGEGYAGVSITAYYLLRDGASWTEIESWTMGVLEAEMMFPEVILRLVGSVGLDPKPILHVGSTACPLTFKGRLCQYAGSDVVCTHTWADCTAKSNTAYFRGYRYAPSPGEVIAIGSAGGFLVGAPAGFQWTHYVLGSPTIESTLPTATVIDDNPGGIRPGIKPI